MSKPGASAQAYPDFQAVPTRHQREQLHLKVSTLPGDAKWAAVAMFTAVDADQQITVGLGRDDAAALVDQLVSWLAAV